jgi:hypothetical protein
MATKGQHGISHKKNSPNFSCLNLPKELFNITDTSK